MQVSREFKGIFLASISATFWGISGAVAQTLFDTTDINSIWLTGIRMLGAGIALLLVSLLTHVDLWLICGRFGVNPAISYRSWLTHYWV